MNQAKILALIAAFFLLIPCVLTSLFPDRSACTELRSVQKFPSFPESFLDMNLWSREFSSYVDDHFILRGPIIRKISRAFYTLGISINKKIIVGQKGWLYLSLDGDLISKYRGIVKLSPEESDEWIRQMSSRVDFLKEKGIACWLIIVPEKSSIYPHYLPEWCTRVGPSLTDTLIQKLKDQEKINWIDLRPVLDTASKQSQVYFKYDTHWNDYGAYLAYQHVMQQIRKDVNVSPLNQHQVRFAPEKVNGDLATALSLNDHLGEESPVAEIPNSRVIHKTSVADYTKDGWVAVTSNPTCRAVILCDSYVNVVMSKYLAESFSCSFFKHHNGMEFNRDLILRHKPNVVLYFVAERYLSALLPGS
jgi:alginate O-acetyltransferase complex protein AlgJ